MSKTSVWFWFWLWQKSLNITKSTNVNICIYLGVWLSLLFIYSFASDGHQRPGIGCQFLKMVTSGNLATVTVESCFLFNISAWLQDFWTHKVNQHSFLTRRVCKHHFVLRVHLAMRKWPRCFLIFKEEKIMKLFHQHRVAIFQEKQASPCSGWLWHLPTHQRQTEKRNLAFRPSRAYTTHTHTHTTHSAQFRQTQS